MKDCDAAHLVLLACTILAASMNRGLKDPPTEGRDAQDGLMRGAMRTGMLCSCFGERFLSFFPWDG